MRTLIVGNVDEIVNFLNILAGIGVASPRLPISRRHADLDAFLEKQTLIAKQGVIANVGTDGGRNEVA